MISEPFLKYPQVGLQSIPHTFDFIEVLMENPLWYLFFSQKIYFLLQFFFSNEKYVSLLSIALQFIVLSLYQWNPSGFDPPLQILALKQGGGVKT